MATDPPRTGHDGRGDTHAPRELVLALIEDAAAAPRTLSAPLPDGAVVLARVERVNPTCGDRVELDVLVRADADGRREVGLRGAASGCTLSRASAELLAAAVEGLDPAAAGALARRLADARLRGTAAEGATDADLVASLEIAPLRRRCVALSWTAVADALAPGSA